MSCLQRAVLMAAFLVLAPASVQAQKPEKPEPDPAIDGLLERLKEAERTRGEQDAEAIKILGDLAGRFERLPDAQQKTVVRAMRSSLRVPRKPTQAKLYEAAGEALSRCGRLGAAVLAEAVDDSRFKNEKEWVQLRARLVLLLGRPADERQVKTLVDIARKDNDDLAAAKAGEALGEYSKHEESVRKEIVKELVKALEEVHGKANGQLGGGMNQHAQSLRWRAIQGPWVATLRRLTGQSLRSVLEWRQWYENHKRDAWDKLGYRLGGPKKEDGEKH